MSSQNARKRTKPHAQSDQRETDYAVVYPRHLWGQLGSYSKRSVRSANASYVANEAALSSRGITYREQSRMSLQVIAKMAGSAPGSNSDGGCPILLRDLNEATRALALHTHAVRRFCMQTLPA